MVDSGVNPQPSEQYSMLTLISYFDNSMPTPFSFFETQCNCSYYKVASDIFKWPNLIFTKNMYIEIYQFKFL